MSRIRRSVFPAWVILLPVLLSTAAHAIQIQPALLDVHQAPSTEKTYSLTLHNDSSTREDVVFYLADWQRLEDGRHDWDIPVNGARWVFEASLPAGVTTIRYSVRLPEGDHLPVQGVFSSRDPASAGAIASASTTDMEPPSTDTARSDLAVTVLRTVESVDPSGIATVALRIQSPAPVEGLTLYEAYATRLEIGSIDSAGSRFDTVNRSSADWTTLPLDQVTLAPGQTRTVQVTVQTPPLGAGTYWSAVVAELRPRESTQNGAQVFTIIRTAIKVLVTLPGTEVAAGRIDRVAVPQTDPLGVQIDFVNTGNTELGTAGEVHVINQNGSTVRILPIDEFKTLPGGHRSIAVTGSPGDAPLPPGIYQAVASLNLGEAVSVVGVRAFRVR